MHGMFNTFLISLNAVLCTPQELYAHNYVGIDVLPCNFLTFILRGSNSVFTFTLLSFPLNRCARLTISVYTL